ncbi:molybdenum cofactor guanylyltransferase [Brachybacterium hainanense]|uniref:Molybdenum cofactor guanylyltransferase n=1 Tax=Brachybacterium hainanense TaxID=1541174 RepID=A0ABV6RFV1_9MICO
MDRARHVPAPPPAGGPHPRTATIVLAGGRSRRMGGVDKTRLAVGGASSLERVLAAAPLGPRIIVGPGDGVPAGVVAVREDPPFSGPVAALERGVREAEALLGAAVAPASEVDVLVLGGDMPLLERGALEMLLGAAGPPDPAAAAAERSIRPLAAAPPMRPVRVAVVEDGHREFLCAAWPLPLLRACLDEVRGGEGDWRDLSLRRLYARIPDELLCEVPLPGHVTADIDTPETLATARARAAAHDPEFPSSGI